MNKIWYLLRCPEGNESDYMERYQRMVNAKALNEIICFQYQRMMRYGGGWHMENRVLLPGYIFVSGTGKEDLGVYGQQSRNVDIVEQENSTDEGRQVKNRAVQEKEEVRLNSDQISWLKTLCSEGNLIDMSRGIIKDGFPVVKEGPLKGREHLIKKIDRHKRVAEIELPFDSRAVNVVVGLEIYSKETGSREK